MTLNHQKVEIICRKMFKNCIVERVSEITEAGMVNPIFEIVISNPSKSLVLKTYPEKWGHYKPGKEKFVFELIKSNTNLCVPEIYILDKSKKILPKTYLLMSKMEGIMPKKAKLSNEEKKNLYFQLGQDLAKLHKIKFSDFGWIYKDKISRYELKYAKPFKTWKEFFFSKYKEVKDELKNAKDKKYGKLNKKSFEKLLPEIDEYIEKNSHLLNTRIEPVLIHNDFSLTNVLVKKNKHWKISAIFDVEMSMTGHNEFELSNMDLLYNKKTLFKLNEQEKSFFEGYQSIKKLSKDFEERQRLYFLYGLISCASFDGFELQASNIQRMSQYYKNIKEILQNG